jgi:hypothetical protein
MNSTDGSGARIESSHQRMSMLRILHASCATALDVFRAARNPLDTSLSATWSKWSSERSWRFGSPNAHGRGPPARRIQGSSRTSSSFASK